MNPDDYTQEQLDDYADQNNPNNDAYQDDLDNHADQCNPNNDEYAGHELAASTSKGQPEYLLGLAFLLENHISGPSSLAFLEACPVSSFSEAFSWSEQGPFPPLFGSVGTPRGWAAK